MKTLPPLDLQDAFDFVGDTFYPRWKRAECRVVEGTPLTAPGFCGLCDPESKTITVSPHVVADTPLELVTILAHEVAHAVTPGSHGKRFRDRLYKAAEDAGEAGYYDLQIRLVEEADAYADYDPAMEEARFYGLVDDTLLDHPNATWEQVRYRLAHDGGMTPEEVEKVYPNMEAQYHNRRAFHEKTRMRRPPSSPAT